MHVVTPRDHIRGLCHVEQRKSIELKLVFFTGVVLTLFAKNVHS